jgi:hypothetical protein
VATTASAAVIAEGVVAALRAVFDAMIAPGRRECAEIDGILSRRATRGGDMPASA